MEKYFGLLGTILIFYVAISKIIRTLMDVRAEYLNIEIKSKKGVLIAIILVFTLVIFYINIIFGYIEGFTDDVIIMNGLMFFMYFVLLMLAMHILIKSITKEIECKNRQVQFENLKEYSKNLEKLYTDMRIFRHDYVNILSSMIGFIENKDIEGLEKHFNNNIIPLGEGMKSNNFKMGLISNIKIYEIKGVFSSKLIRAQELGIDVFIDIAEAIEKINMDIIDLARCIGILLDNAIEAAEKSEKKYIKTAIIKRENDILIVITNSYNEEIHLNKLYKKGFSTKGENRGLGLYSLQKIKDKYFNVSLDTVAEEGEFRQLFQIINKKLEVENA